VRGEGGGSYLPLWEWVVLRFKEIEVEEGRV
jgi:hypothetical protein